mgnify:CR=1 FL=1
MSIGSFTTEQGRTLPGHVMDRVCERLLQGDLHQIGIDLRAYIPSADPNLADLDQTHEVLHEAEAQPHEPTAQE